MSNLFLVPSNPAPERSLLYGPQGAGKTSAYFSIAAKTSGHFYVIDTDITVIDFLAGERFAHLADRITWEVPENFAHAIELAEKWSMAAVPGEDWLVCDRIDWAWDEAQSEFSEEVFGGSIDEHFLTYRKAVEEGEGKAGNPFEGFTDWPTIKKRHDRLVKAFLRGTARGVHWIWTAAEKKVDDKVEKDPNVLRDYGGIGARPAGNKTNGHVPRTVIRMLGNSPKTWRMTTVKDRERLQLDNTTVGDFANDYLLKVAKWTPRVKEVAG